MIDIVIQYCSYVNERWPSMNNISISPTQNFQRNPNIVSSEIDNEVVMMDENFEFYFGLHAIGTEVWNLLEQPNSIEKIAKKLLQKYDVSNEQCVDDLKSLFADFLENGMIQAV